jgi:hypothetical protein
MQHAWPEYLHSTSALTGYMHAGNIAGLFSGTPTYTTNAMRTCPLVIPHMRMCMCMSTTRCDKDKDGMCTSICVYACMYLHMHMYTHTHMQEMDKILGEHAKVEQGLRSYNQRILAAVSNE